jgi:hypothetical protein
MLGWAATWGPGGLGAANKFEQGHVGTWVRSDRDRSLHVGKAGSLGALKAPVVYVDLILIFFYFFFRVRTVPVQNVSVKKCVLFSSAHVRGFLGNDHAHAVELGAGTDLASQARRIGQAQRQVEHVLLLLVGLLELVKVGLLEDDVAR